jgi:ribosomal-protein-alanine N-acetyltransferase
MRRLIDSLFGRQTPVFAEASAQDAAAIALLHGRSFHRGWSEDEFEHLLLDRDVLAHRATIGRKLAGFIIARRVGPEAEILSVATARSQQGRGIAGGLLRLHLGRLAGLGVKVVFLEVDENNEPALRLYRKSGFREVGRRQGYYSGGPAGSANALTLRRDLVS